MKESLLPGLPDEIALDCLARVPYQFHSGLRSVCRGWNDLFADPSFYRLRMMSSNGEDFVCLVQALVTNPDAESDLGRNPVEEEEEKAPLRPSPPAYGLTFYNVRSSKWHRMPLRPLLPAGIPTFCQCVAVGRRLVLLGGWDPTTLESVPDVYVCDLARGGKWRRGAPMSAARSFFACAAAGIATVYVAGGHDNQKNALRTAEVYDLDSNTWRALPPMVEERDECQGLTCLSGRFWVISGYSTDSQGQFCPAAECYDPVHGKWTKADGVWPFSNASPVSACCWTTPKKRITPPKTQSTSDLPHLPSLLSVDTNSRSVKEFDNASKTWKIAASIPDYVSSSPCVSLISRDPSTPDQMFVIGSKMNGVEGNCHQACVLDMGSRRWTEIDTPLEFSGSVYSASSFYL